MTEPITKASKSVVTGSPVDPRPLFSEAVEAAGRTISAVSHDRLGDPTPCEEFDVARLLDHMVLVLERVAAMGRGEEALSVQETERSSGWSEAWAAADDDWRSSWADDAILERTLVLPWTKMAGADVLRIYLSEVIVHTWDLARATGQQVSWDPEGVSVALETMRRELPAEGRREMIEEAAKNLPAGAAFSPPFAEAVNVPADSPLVSQLVAWTGRVP